MENALTVLMADTSVKLFPPAPKLKVTSPEVAVMVLAEKYSPPVPIFSPLKVNPPAVPIVETDIVPEPAPVIVKALSAVIPTFIVRSELPVPLVMVATPDATTIEETVRSVVDPRLIVVVPDADSTPRLCASPASVEAAALNVKAPASIVVALTCPDPAPNVIETESPDIS
jgi:hypothetical protein